VPVAPRARCWIVAAVAGLASLPAVAGEPPPPHGALCPNGEDGCIEQCALREFSEEAPSPVFRDRLASLAPTKHHVDSGYGAEGLERLPWFRIANVGGLSPEAVARWQRNRRYAGPCAGLEVVFHSKAVEDADDKNVVDLYELRYEDAAAARRVQALLTFAPRNWDWNYHPFSAAYHDQSVFVVEGRWRAWSAFKAVAAHFGAPIIGKEPAAPLPPCAPEGKPLVPTPGDERLPVLSVFALGFSPTGRLAWLEQQVGAEGRGVDWSIHVVELSNDRALPGKSFRGAPDVATMCAQHGAEVSGLLHDAGIVSSLDLALEGSPSGGGRLSAWLRPSSLSVWLNPGGDPNVYDVLLHGPEGNKKLGVIRPGDDVYWPQIAGLLRSPFEPRVAVTLGAQAGDKVRGMRFRFYGGRLDKGWTPPSTAIVPRW
jgi:hypothetical protein